VILFPLHGLSVSCTFASFWNYQMKIRCHLRGTFVSPWVTLYFQEPCFRYRKDKFVVGPPAEVCISNFDQTVDYFVMLSSSWCLELLWLQIAYGSVFQPFCCRGTLHKRVGHSRNPMHWSVSHATDARMKLQGVYGLISLAGHWGQSRREDDKADKEDKYEILMH